MGVYIHALIPAMQWTRTPRPLSSSAWMNATAVARCLSRSSSSESSRLTCSLWNVYVIVLRGHHEPPRLYRTTRTSEILTVPRIAVSTLWTLASFRRSVFCALRRSPSHRPGMTSFIAE